MVKTQQSLMCLLLGGVEVALGIFSYFMRPAMLPRIFSTQGKLLQSRFIPWSSQSHPSKAEAPQALKCEPAHVLLEALPSAASQASHCW